MQTYLTCLCRTPLVTLFFVHCMSEYILRNCWPLPAPVRADVRGCLPYFTRVHPHVDHRFSAMNSAPVPDASYTAHKKLQLWLLMAVFLLSGILQLSFDLTYFLGSHFIRIGGDSSSLDTTHVSHPVSPMCTDSGTQCYRELRHRVHSSSRVMYHRSHASWTCSLVSSASGCSCLRPVLTVSAPLMTLPSSAFQSSRSPRYNAAEMCVRIFALLLPIWTFLATIHPNHVRLRSRNAV